VASITDQKNPVEKMEKLNMADSKWRLKFEKNPKKLNFFCSTNNSFKFLLNKHFKIYWRIFRRKPIRIYLEKQYGGLEMAARTKNHEENSFFPTLTLDSY